MLLKKLLAPKLLGIILQAPVLLLRNLDERHVNGLIGMVEQTNIDTVEVKFEIFGKSEIVKIGKFSVTKFDPATKVCIVNRTQYPFINRKE